MVCSPTEPPFATADLPGVGGRIGSSPEDFQVDEIPLYAASGEGQHLYVRLRKRGLTTPQLVDILSRASGADRREIGSAGMKDKHAVTTQWLSLPRTGTRDPAEWQLPDGVEVLEVSCHKNKLRTGHLSGNHFRIRLVDLEGGEQLAARVEQLRKALAEQGLLNFFGAQRFGIGGQNLERALAWLRRSSRPRDRFEAKLYPSVVQSEIFNRYLMLRRARGLDRLMQGEVVRLEGSSAHFVVTDPAAEQSRLEQGDIHLTGPMVGPKMRPAENQAAMLEGEVTASQELDEGAWSKLARHAPGTRRDLLVRTEDLSTELETPSVLRLAFKLPAGSYATQLVREFTRGAFLDDPRGAS